MSVSDGSRPPAGWQVSYRGTYTYKPSRDSLSRARAQARGDRELQEDFGSDPSGPKSALVGAWVEWVDGMRPVIQGHGGAEFPLSRRQWLGLVGEQQGHFRQACGERPTAVVAMQGNQRGGLHAHWLLCGSDRLRDPSRKLAWQLARIVGARMIGADQPLGVSNQLRALIVPIEARGVGRTSALTSYIVRYVLREDVEQAVEVLV